MATEKIKAFKPYMLAAIIAQLTLPLTALCKDTNWYANGLSHELNGNYKLAIESYINSANNGVNQAGFALGRIYRELGDNNLSFEWFLQSAKSGNKLSQFELGLIYANGNSAVTEDKSEASKWLTLAAESGVGEASFELFKLEGDVQYLISAAVQGVPKSILELSNSYKYGLHGLGVDLGESEYWNRIYIDSKE